MESHLDTAHSIDHLTIPQRLNIWADNLAKHALITAHRTNRYTKPEYPGETVRLFLDGHKVTSSIKRALYSSWGTRVAKTLFHNKKIIQSRHFHLVDWDNVDRTINSLPKMLQVWITKHVSGFCGTNTHLSLINPAQTNRCQCCGSSAETTMHITRCPNPGRVKMFDDTVTTLINWMDSKNGYPPLTQSILTYLWLKGRKRMTEVCAHLPALSSFARDHDRLGWNNFIMGRISISLFEVQKAHLRQSQSRLSISSWACQFTQRILAIPHQQWLYRNARIHIRLIEGLTAADHNRIQDRVSHLLHTDPDDLLPQHQPLLLKQNFYQLGIGTSLDRQHWIAQMNSAIAAASHATHKRTREDTQSHNSNKKSRL